MILAHVEFAMVALVLEVGGHSCWFEVEEWARAL
jgi:hypothetical protein